MKLQKRCINILAAFLILGSCKLVDISNQSLTNDGDKNDTLLNGVMGNPALFPPLKIKSAGVTLDSGDFIYLRWDSVPFADKYGVYSSAVKNGEYKLVEKVITLSCKVPIVVVETGTAQAFYKITSFNTNGVESGFSSPVNGAISRLSKYNEAAGMVFVSKGTLAGVKVEWIPAAGAAYHQIYRALNLNEGSSEYRLIESMYIPEKETDSMYSFVDYYVEPGCLYDYKVIPFDQFGGRGAEGSIGREGFIYPIVQDCTASYGSEVRGNDGLEYSMLDITWKIRTKLWNGSGEQASVKVDNWKIVSSFAPSSPKYYLLEDIFNPFGPDLGELKALIKYEGLHLKDGIEIDYSQSTVDPNLFTKDDYEDESGISWKYCIYRIGVINKSLPELQFLTSWYKNYYFRVSGIYNADSFLQYETVPGNLCRGFAARPDAVKYEQSKINISHSYSPATGVTLKIKKVNLAGSVTEQVSSYKLFRRTDGDFIYSARGDEVIADGSAEEYVFIDNLVTAGTIYYYAFCFTGSNGADSNYTQAVEISIPAAGNQENG